MKQKKKHRKINKKKRIGHEKMKELERNKAMGKI